MVFLALQGHPNWLLLSTHTLSTSDISSYLEIPAEIPAEIANKNLNSQSVSYNIMLFMRCDLQPSSHSKSRPGYNYIRRDLSLVVTDPSRVWILPSTVDYRQDLT